MENNELNPVQDSLKDAAPKEIAETIVRILDRKKARDIKLLFVEKQTIIADYFVICTGTSSTQIKSLADEVSYKLGIAGVETLRTEGENSWILIDFGCVIVHIFNNESRNFYNLEKLWNDATETNIKDLLISE